MLFFVLLLDSILLDVKAGRSTVEFYSHIFSLSNKDPKNWWNQAEITGQLVLLYVFDMKWTG